MSNTHIQARRENAEIDLFLNNQVLPLPLTIKKILLERKEQNDWVINMSKR